MPNYFLGYETIVNFVDIETLKKEHSGLPHGGRVIRLGESSSDNKQIIEYGLKLDSIQSLQEVLWCMC